MSRSKWVRASVGVALVAVAAFGSLLSGQASSGEVVAIRDDCDAATFNQAIGPGTCVGKGETTFQEFIAQLQEEKIADAWKFDPGDVDLKAGEPLTVVNQGGETHTFTNVRAFGGGFVALLNGLSGNPVPRSECAVTLPDGSLVPNFGNPGLNPVGPGGSLTIRTGGFALGRHLFMCCIHPWMRTVLTVEA